MNGNKKKLKKGTTLYKRTTSGNDNRTLSSQKPKLPTVQADMTDTKNESLSKLGHERTTSQQLLAKLELAGQL